MLFLPTCCLKKDASRAFHRQLDKGLIDAEGVQAWQACKSRKMKTEFIQGTMSNDGREWSFNSKAPVIKD